MPRYFFHVYDDIVAIDEEGAVLPHLAAARLQAVAGARDLMSEQVRHGYLRLAHWIDTSTTITRSSFTCRSARRSASRTPSRLGNTTPARRVLSLHTSEGGQMPVSIVLAAALAATVPAQDSIDAHGIRSGGVTIDASGIHLPAGSARRHGVRMTAGGGGDTIVTNNGHRSVDCGGHALTIDGNHNVLTIANCRSITVGGNDNTLSIAFVHDGSASLVGNRNRVITHAPRTVRVAVSNVGSRNRVTRAER